MTEMGLAHVKLAVADCLRSHDWQERRLDAIRRRLWREPPDLVAEAYDMLILGGLDAPCPERGGGIGLRAARMKELRRPLPKRNKVGLQLLAIAEQGGMCRETLARLMEQHGYLEMVPYGGSQSRRLVTDTAFHAGLGHNVDPGAIRSPRLDGNARAAVFPIFYPEAVPLILWTLDWEGIQGTVRGITNKRARMGWLLAHHPYLPGPTMAAVAGYSLRGVKKARCLHIR